MGDLIYRPLINDMTWSYSRVESFKSCKYKWFLKYIKGYRDSDMFYSSYGKFIHKLLENYYKGFITQSEMYEQFLLDFSKEVKGDRPKENIVTNYIDQGMCYLKSFKPLDYKLIDVEKEVRFDVAGNPFIGFIDYVGYDGEDIVIVDNKSRSLKPRSKKTKPTAKDKELDDMLRQLYIYSVAIKQEFGIHPSKLCFNCFRSGVFIEEPFNEGAYNEAIEWACKKIEEIKNCEDFHPTIDYFSCNYLCGVGDYCCYKNNG